MHAYCPERRRDKGRDKGREKPGLGAATLLSTARGTGGIPTAARMAGLRSKSVCVIAATLAVSQ